MNYRVRSSRPNKGRDSSVFRRKASALKASEDGRWCWICGAEIDRSLPESMSNDPAYWTVDHDPPLADGGSLLTGLRAAHRGCNSREGGKLGNARMRAKLTGAPMPTRPTKHSTLHHDDADINEGWERSRAW